MAKIHRQTLLDDMVRRQSLPLPQASQAAKAILAIIQEGLERDGVVHVINFGTFRLKPVTARRGFNPQTRQPITIPAHQRIVFSPAKALRDHVLPPSPSPLPIPDDAPPPPQPVAASLPEPGPPAGSGVGVVGGIASVAPASPPPSQAAAVPHLVSATGMNEKIPFEHDHHTLQSRPAQPQGKDRDNARRPTRRYYLGAAALAALALLIAGLLLEPAANVASVPAVGEVVPPSVADSAEPAAANWTAPAQTLAAEAVVSEPTPAAGPEPVAEPDAAGHQPPAESVAATAVPPANHFFTEQTLRVNQGDTLWGLASQHYQNPWLWPHIYQANTEHLSDPDLLPVKSSLVIPTLQGPPGDLSPEDRTHIAEGYYLTYLHYQKKRHKDAMLVLQVAQRYDPRILERHR